MEFIATLFIESPDRVRAEALRDEIVDLISHTADWEGGSISIGPLTLPKAVNKRQSRALDHPGPEASEAEIKAFYKATAPREDLKFTRRFCSPELAAEIDQLLAGKPTATDAQRMRDKRRIEATASDRNPAARPESYKDFSMEYYSDQCAVCGHQERLHTSDFYRKASTCPTFQPKLLKGWHCWRPIEVPAAEFEAKFRRIAEGWNGARIAENIRANEYEFTEDGERA